MLRHFLRNISENGNVVIFRNLLWSYELSFTMGGVNNRKNSYSCSQKNRDTGQIRISGANKFKCMVPDS